MADYRSKRVFVTGANGFVGAHMVARLMAQGAVVTCLLRPTSDRSRFDALGIEPRVLICDLNDPKRLDALVRPLAAEYVFHLAAERDHNTLARADVEGRSACAGINVMEAAASEHLVRFVSVGSASEVSDGLTGQPGSLHGKSKARELLALRILAKKLNIRYAPTRTHYVYGPLQSRRKLVPVAIRAARDGLTVPLTGPDICKRYVYVLDLVEALLQVPDIPATQQKVHLITSPQQVTNLTVVKKIAALMGKPITIAPNSFAEREFDRSDWDLSEAGTPLPAWQPTTSLDDGLRACVNWEAEALV